LGVALAEAARDRGASVVLVAGSIEVALPGGVGIDVVRIESTGDLRAGLGRVMFGGSRDGDRPADALVMAAAVADFSPVRVSPVKVSRAEGLTLQLESTPDLLAEIGRIVRGVDAVGAATRAPVAPRPILVGFAAETGSLERAAEKLRTKGVDLLVANDVAEAGSGFGTDTNRVSILDAAGARDDLPLLSKREVADRILDRVAAALDARDAAAQTVASATSPDSSHADPSAKEASR
jgi:phosphopantothenoylcysteine decarboxylase/phosphopantothenate--cysteine ligase